MCSCGPLLIATCGFVYSIDPSHVYGMDRRAQTGRPAPANDCQSTPNIIHSETRGTNGGGSVSLIRELARIPSNENWIATKTNRGPWHSIDGSIGGGWTCSSNF